MTARQWPEKVFYSLHATRRWLDETLKVAAKR